MVEQNRSNKYNNHGRSNKHLDSTSIKFSHADKLVSEGAYDSAAREYVELMRKGCKDAYCKLAWLFYNGELRSGKNDNSAWKYFESAANNDIGEGYYGQYIISRQHDYQNFMLYLIQAAKLGYEPAKLQYEIETGEKFDLCNPIVKSVDKIDFIYLQAKRGNSAAYRLLREKADNEDGKACYYIGKMYQHSRVENHIELSVSWFNKSMIYGYKDGYDGIKEINRLILDPGNRCPMCGKKLTVKPGNNGGYFKGCTGFPECDYTIQIKTR